MDENPGNALQLSVVLATYNRAETVRRTLDHLAKQDLDPRAFEVIAIDDGSPDDTERVIAEIKTQVPFELSYMRHENRGPGFTQNRGIRVARAPIVLLMADDIFLAPGALRAHLDAHARHPERESAVLGKVLQSPELTQSVFLRHWDPFGFVAIEGANELPYYWFWACNVSVKREFMLEHGMFHEPKGRGGAAAHEDVELGYRLHQHGMRLWHEERAFGHHYHVYTLDQAIRRYHERGLNWGEFRSLVPDPEFIVTSHLLTRETAAEYVRVLRGPNSLHGRERHLSWHLLREGIRRLAFNRATVQRLWRPLMDRAEVDPRTARWMSKRVYAGFLFHHFVSGVRDARVRFGS